MNRLPQLLAILKSRTALIILAVGLLLLNVGRFATNQYLDYLDGIESKRALLGQYQISTRNLEEMRKRVARLEAQKKRFESHLLVGENRQDITSAMQIKIQEMLSKSGLSPESLRPVNRRREAKDKEYGEVTIKVRLSGELESFVKFMAEIYRQRYLFKVDNFTLKPFKNKNLKVFLEIKGFYKITPAQEKSAK